MGTSVSQRSPSTPNWHAVSVGYTSDAIPIERVVQEIWRAATNQPTGDLASDLGAPLIARCFSIALTASSREEAVHAVRREIALSGQASLAADIAQRAVAQSFRSGEDRASAFAQSLFAEAGNYFISRDLPGYVGINGRAQTVSESIAFKRQLREQIVGTVRTIPTSGNVASQPSAWKDYVSNVVNHLAGRG
jgi:hypothetical protein